MANNSPDIVIEDLVYFSEHSKRVFSDTGIFTVNKFCDDLDLLLSKGHRLHLAEDVCDLIKSFCRRF